MKRLTALIAIIMAVFMTPALAHHAKTLTTGDKSYSVKKDDAYWTRVWYAKQRKKGTVRKASYRSSKRAKRRLGVSRYGVVARVNLSTQRMHVYKNGRRLYTWKVSSGRAGYRTPTGSYRVGRMHKRYFSRKYNGAPMPYAMFFRGGYAIHGTNSIGRLGRTASHGCIRLHPSHAATLFSMVRRSGGRVKITY
ncbi:MAG: L,D-transpeptidase [Pseudomonadota bacterium]